LGSPEASDTTASNATCANLADLKAASSELMAVMRAKSAYLIARIDREVAKAPAAGPTQVAKSEPTAAPAPPPPAATAPVAATPAPAPAPFDPARKTDPEQSDVAKAPAASADKAAPQGPEAARQGSESTSSWNTTTAEAIVPAAPQEWHQPPRESPPAYDPPQPGSPPGMPYELPPQGAYDDQNGYSIDEIRAATTGFFGTISTSLASVIEHAFQQAGRPTAYVLGEEGGGAFLAGIRYGEGTLYLRSGGRQKVYWHGPSIGYDLGVDGSRTLFLIYRLDNPDRLYRQFTGIDGSAYLVGGVGMTLLKGGPVLMAPIRSGLGLRLGANIGYVRFTPRSTWNPF
jgi:hypothetical protein